MKCLCWTSMNFHKKIYFFPKEKASRNNNTWNNLLRCTINQLVRTSSQHLTPRCSENLHRNSLCNGPISLTIYVSCDCKCNLKLGQVIFAMSVEIKRTSGRTLRCSAHRSGLGSGLWIWVGHSDGQEGVFGGRQWKRCNITWIQAGRWDTGERWKVVVPWQETVWEWVKKKAVKLLCCMCACLPMHQRGRGDTRREAGGTGGGLYFQILAFFFLIYPSFK